MNTYTNRKKHPSPTKGRVRKQHDLTDYNERKRTHSPWSMAECVCRHASDRDFAFCDAPFFAVFEIPRPPSFWSSFSGPSFFQELVGRCFHLLTQRSLLIGFLTIVSIPKKEDYGQGKSCLLPDYAFKAAKERLTAASVSLISCSVWAVVTNQASYFDGARQMPSSSIRRKKRANNSPSAFWAAS
jgi:hypothetical protein